MEYAEFRRHLSKAGLSLSAFARLIEVKPGSVSNHSKTGVVPKHYAVLAVLLGHLGDEHIDFRALFEKHGVPFERAVEPTNLPVQLTLISSRGKR